MSGAAVSGEPVTVDLMVGEPAGDAIYFDSFDGLVESGAAAYEASPGKWHLQRGRWGARGGQLLAAEPETGAPSISYAPGLSGQYAIFVGAYGEGKGQGNFIGEQHGIYVRLSSDPHYTFLVTERWGPSYEEMYFKTVDLTGVTMEVANLGKHSALDYIKLVPVRRAPLSASRGQVIGILDFTDDVFTSQPAGFEAGSAIRRHAEAGYSAVMWKAYAVRCEYYTRIGEQRTYTYTDDEIEQRAAGEQIDLSRSRKGIGGLLEQYDTMRQAVDEAHKVGLPIFGWARISNEFAKLNHQFSPTTPFHLAHPDAFQRERDGTLTPQLSFAYPEVRQHKVDILCEIAAYGMDGIMVDILRHPPMARFDLPLVEAYREETGRDPRQMDGDGDEAWLRFRSGVFTQFLREARAALDAQAGRRLPIWIRTVEHPWRNLLIGCDVDTWVEQRLVDGIIFGTHCGTAVDYPEQIDLRHYVDLAQKHGHGSDRVQVFGQVWRYGPGVQSEYLAKGLYSQGVDGVALYESNATVAFPTMRQRIWRMARPEYLRA